MRKSTAIAALFVLIAALSSMPAKAVHGGCIVLGEGQGLDTQRECTYVATTTTQNVYVGTPYDWRVWVLRHSPSGQPLDITLAAGIGPVVGPLPQVHPEVGEEVHVTMWAGITGPYYGTIVFLAAGLEEGHP